jgi:hypothetical protein
MHTANGFVIELKNRLHPEKPPIYIGQVEVSSDTVKTFEFQTFRTLAEASQHSFPNAEDPTELILGGIFPKTENVEYAVVPAIS